MIEKSNTKVIRNSDLKVESGLKSVNKEIKRLTDNKNKYIQTENNDIQVMNSGAQRRKTKLLRSSRVKQKITV